MAPRRSRGGREKGSNAAAAAAKIPSTASNSLTTNRASKRKRSPSKKVIEEAAAASNEAQITASPARARQRIVKTVSPEQPSPIASPKPTTTQPPKHVEILDIEEVLGPKPYAVKLTWHAFTEKGNKTDTRDERTDKITFDVEPYSLFWCHVDQFAEGAKNDTPGHRIDKIFAKVLVEEAKGSKQRVVEYNTRVRNAQSLYQFEDLARAWKEEHPHKDLNILIEVKLEPEPITVISSPPPAGSTPSRGVKKVTATQKQRAELEEELKANPHSGRMMEVSEAHRCANPRCRNNKRWCYVVGNKHDPTSHFHIDKNDLRSWAQAVHDEKCTIYQPPPDLFLKLTKDRFERESQLQAAARQAAQINPYQFQQSLPFIMPQQNQFTMPQFSFPQGVTMWPPATMAPPALPVQAYAQHTPEARSSPPQADDDQDPADRLREFFNHLIDLTKNPQASKNRFGASEAEAIEAAHTTMAEQGWHIDTLYKHMDRVTWKEAGLQPGLWVLVYAELRLWVRRT